MGRLVHVRPRFPYRAKVAGDANGIWRLGHDGSDVKSTRPALGMERSRWCMQCGVSASMSSGGCRAVVHRMWWARARPHARMCVQARDIERCARGRSGGMRGGGSRPATPIGEAPAEARARRPGRHPPPALHAVLHVNTDSVDETGARFARGASRWAKRRHGRARDPCSMHEATIWQMRDGTALDDITIVTCSSTYRVACACGNWCYNQGIRPSDSRQRVFGRR
jgi:hypothetical protein